MGGLPTCWRVAWKVGIMPPCKANKLQPLQGIPRIFIFTIWVAIVCYFSFHCYLIFRTTFKKAWHSQKNKEILLIWLVRTKIEFRILKIIRFFSFFLSFKAQIKKSSSTSNCRIVVVCLKREEKRERERERGIVEKRDNSKAYLKSAQ